VEVCVRLRGRHRLELWDPHTGEIAPCKTEAPFIDGVDAMRMRLKLASVRSVFLMGE